MRRSPAGRPSDRAGFCERLMVAKVRDLRSSAAAVSYYEKDGYYAKDDPEHRDASFWHGGAAKDLGLRAHVLPRGFESVLAGYVPGTEIRLGRMREGENDRRPGWDLTLSAPKSVSLEALVVGDRRVIRAHDDAVRATLDWVEKELLQTRGFDPATRRRPRVAANGMAVAGFRHLTSRIGDPQLHTHCVLANMTRNASGEWRSVEPTSIKRSEKLIGAVYRNELARRLQALGMAVTARMVGQIPGFELAGYDRSFMDAFSGRRAEILAWLKEHDLPYNAKNAETAAVHTRPSKQDTRLSDLVPQWRERARELGLARDRGALRPDRPIDPVTGERAEPVEVPPPDLPANELRSLRRAPSLPRLPRDAAGERAVSARSGAPAELSPVAAGQIVCRIGAVPRTCDIGQSRPARRIVEDITVLKGVMIPPIELAVETVDGTWKLNQNRPDEARLTAAGHVETGSFGTETALLAGLMRNLPATEAAPQPPAPSRQSCRPARETDAAR